jgi:hypothetical protein
MEPSMLLRPTLALAVGLAAGLTLAADAGARPARRTGTRWLGTDGVPLAVSGRNPVGPAPADACMRWGKRGSRWRGIDAWGQEAGRARVTTGATMDAVLGVCRYPELDVVSGRESVVYVSDGSSFRAPASAQWIPGDGERRAFDHFLAQLGPLAGIQVDGTAPVFFRAPARGMAGPEEWRFAVVGGTALVVARCNGAGVWSLDHLARGVTKIRPLAVFDMDGDGVPEILHDWERIDDHGRSVLGLDAWHGGWRTVAESDFGSTA